MGLIDRLSIGVARLLSRATLAHSFSLVSCMTKGKGYLKMTYRPMLGTALLLHRAMKKNKDILTKEMTREQIANAQKLSHEYWEDYKSK